MNFRFGLCFLGSFWNIEDVSSLRVWKVRKTLGFQKSQNSQRVIIAGNQVDLDSFRMRRAERAKEFGVAGGFNFVSQVSACPLPLLLSSAEDRYLCH